MSKIDELLSPILVLQYKSDIEVVEKAMKEYAEWYAKRMQNEIINQCWIDDYGQVLINEATIKNIKLPEHE